MPVTTVYDEVIDMIANAAPKVVADFQMSEQAAERLYDLIAGSRDDTLSPAERSELEHYLQLEHILRLAKIRARKTLAGREGL